MSDDILTTWAADMGVPVEELRQWTAVDWQRHLDRRNAEAIVESAAFEVVNDLSGGAP